MTTLKCTLFWIWDNMHHLSKSVSFNEIVDHPAAFTKLMYHRIFFMLYISTNGPKLQNTTHVRFCIFRKLYN